MCDDYNFGHLPDVKKAIDEFVKNNKLNWKYYLMVDLQKLKSNYL